MPQLLSVSAKLSILTFLETILYPLTFSVFGVRSSQSVQKSSSLAEFFRKKIFERLKCTVAPFFALERCRIFIFQAILGAQIAKISIFWPNFKCRKMTSRCPKLLPNHLFWTLKGSYIRFDTLEVLHGHIFMPLRRLEKGSMSTIFRQKINFFQKKNFFS